MDFGLYLVPILSGYWFLVTLEGALACLIEDYSVTGIQAERDQPRLL